MEMGHMIADPLFILAPHRSFTSVVCALLGQHPQMYGLPELNLFETETLGEWWVTYRRARAMGAHGLLRAVAQLYAGEQTAETIELARWWLRRRLHWDTGAVFKELARGAHPLTLVDKSPTTVYASAYLQRLLTNFPRARFLHLLRHPRSYGESIFAMPLGRLWIARHGSFDFSTNPPTLDPQVSWLTVHENICSFLSPLPGWQQMRIRGEDLLAEPYLHLRQIAEWLGLRTDAEAIQEMKHPERSPFACFGPPGARLGNDPSFLERPALRPGHEHPQSLAGRLSWREDGSGFSPQVKQLARKFGYH
jgi:hypothetical protein